ncbi:MAG: DJ-1/PfpI family protein [Bacteroidota bacterium]
MVKNSILLILPATDFNEQEYLVIANTLERANIKIFIASNSNSLCTGSEGLKVKNDIQLYNIHESNFGGIIIIGGKGTRNYWDNQKLHNILQQFNKNRKPIGAICSAPVMLVKAGLVNDCATCYPDDRNELEREGIEYKNTPVYQNKNIITAQNPASAQEFAKVFLYELAKRNK